MIEAIILIAVVGILNIVCFFVGAKVGQKVVNKETIKLPKINPMEIYKDKQEKREAEQEIKEIEIMLQNIDNYGTNKKQQEIK
jgi:hypothetical protein